MKQRTTTLYGQNHLLLSGLIAFILGVTFGTKAEAPPLVVDLIKEEEPETLVIDEEVKSSDFNLAVADVLDNVMDQDEVRGGVIYRYVGLAIDEQHRTGFPASVKLAQMIVEGGFSKSNPHGSEIFQHGLNPFGIRYWRPNYPSHIENWDLYVEGYIDTSNGRFCKFRDVEAAFAYHSDFVMSGDRYKKHLPKDFDYNDMLIALEKGGYAEEGHYRKVLTDVIERYNLSLLDNL